MKKLIKLFGQPKKKGTLRHRLRKTKKTIYAKTGYLKGVVALAGYIDPFGPEPKTFVILINGHKSVDKTFTHIEDALFETLENL